MTPKMLSFKDTLVRGAEEMGTPLNESQITAFHKHAELLLKWNKTHNLTAITDPVEMAVKHWLDSIYVLSALKQDGAKLMDLGTGAGFPGIPIKIMRPDLFITLIDASRKKTTFLLMAIHELGLSGIKAVHGKAGKTDVNKYGSFDIIISRAVSDLSSLWQIAEPLLSAQGLFLSMKGLRVNDELVRFKKSESCRGLKIITNFYTLPILKARRCLVSVQRGNT